MAVVERMTLMRESVSDSGDQEYSPLLATGCSVVEADLRARAQSDIDIDDDQIQIEFWWTPGAERATRDATHFDLRGERWIVDTSRRSDRRHMRMTGTRS